MTLGEKEILVILAGSFTVTAALITAIVNLILGIKANRSKALQEKIAYLELKLENQIDKNRSLSNKLKDSLEYNLLLLKKEEYLIKNYIKSGTLMGNRRKLSSLLKKEDERFKGVDSLSENKIRSYLKDINN